MGTDAAQSVGCGNGAGIAERGGRPLLSARAACASVQPERDDRTRECDGQSSCDGSASRAPIAALRLEACGLRVPRSPADALRRRLSRLARSSRSAACATRHAPMPRAEPFRVWARGRGQRRLPPEMRSSIMAALAHEYLQHFALQAAGRRASCAPVLIVDDADGGRSVAASACVAGHLAPVITGLSAAIPWIPARVCRRAPRPGKNAAAHPALPQLLSAVW